MRASGTSVGAGKRARGTTRGPRYGTPPPIQPTCTALSSRPTAAARASAGAGAMAIAPPPTACRVPPPGAERERAGPGVPVRHRPAHGAVMALQRARRGCVAAPCPPSLHSVAMPTRAAVPCAAALLLAAALQGSHAFRIDTSCDGSTVALAVRTAGTGPQPAALVYAQPSPLGPRLPLTRARATALPIVAGPACGPLPPADGGAVVLPRGTCSFADKAAAARGAGAGLLVVFQAGNDTQGEGEGGVWEG